jgi:hypothetical protein
MGGPRPDKRHLKNKGFVAGDQAVASGSPEGFGEHFVRDTFECVIEVLIAATTGGELGEDGQGPTSGEE